MIRRVPSWWARESRLSKELSERKRKKILIADQLASKEGLQWIGYESGSRPSLLRKVCLVSIGSWAEVDRLPS
jgi:hypothetical protein